MPSTKVARIDLTTVQDFETFVTETCDSQLFAGFRLAASFVLGTDLVLIFQKVA
jgi:hypothetical protein